MYFDRKWYLNQLIAKKNNALIKVITGARRSGKSYLMNQIFYGSLLKDGVKEKNIIRFDFDNDEKRKSASGKTPMSLIPRSSEPISKA